MFKFTNEAYNKFCTALFIAFIGCAAGYTVSEANVTQSPAHVDEVQTFDEFSYKAPEVNTLMQATLSNPTEERLLSANNNLAIMSWGWVSRHDGANKGLFIDYLAACRLVIDEAQAGHDITDETKEMNKLYGMLNPEE